MTNRPSKTQQKPRGFPQRSAARGALRTLCGIGRFALEKLEVPGMLPDGSIPLDLLNQNIVVEIPNSPDIHAGDDIQLYINGTSPFNAYGEPHRVLSEEVSNPSFRFILEIYKPDFPENGTTLPITLDYRVFDPITDDGQFSRMTVTLIFDQQAPGGSSLPYLVFTPEQLLDGITDEDLAGEYLEVRVSPWYLMEVDDVITGWLGSSDTIGALIPGTALTVEQPGCGNHPEISPCQPQGTGKWHSIFWLSTQGQTGEHLRRITQTSDTH